MTSVSLVDWKIEPRRIERGAQRHRVGQIAVMGDREAALGKIGEQRLDVAQRGFAGGRIADMADRDRARQLADDVVAVEIAGDMAHGAVGVIVGAVEADDAGGFLAAVLERVEAERDEAGGAVGAPDSENAALLAELVVVERVGRQHEFRANPRGFARHIGALSRICRLSPCSKLKQGGGMRSIIPASRCCSPPARSEPEPACQSPPALSPGRAATGCASPVRPGSYRGGLIAYGAGDVNCSASGRLDGARAGMVRWSRAAKAIAGFRLTIEGNAVRIGQVAGGLRLLLRAGRDDGRQDVQSGRHGATAVDLAGDPLC